MDDYAGKPHLKGEVARQVVAEDVLKIFETAVIHRYPPPSKAVLTAGVRPLLTHQYSSGRPQMENITHVRYNPPEVSLPYFRHATISMSIII